ncbi:hypothetical protein [Caproicibacter sp. BJN0012]
MPIESQHAQTGAALVRQVWKSETCRAKIRWAGVESDTNHGP